MKLYIIITCAILLNLKTFAGPPQYSLRHYTGEDGLPQNSVKFIAPDKNGFLWLATESGLVRFSGYGFKVFDKQNTCLASNRICYLVPSFDHKYLYVVTEKGDICYVNKNSTSLQKDTGMTGRNPQNRIICANLQLSPVGGLSDLYRHTITFDTLLFPLAPDSAFRVTDKIVLFDSFHGEHDRTRFPGADPWRFFTLGKQLYYLGKKGRIVTFDRGRVPAVKLRGSILKDASYKRGSLVTIYRNEVTGSVFFSVGRSLYQIKALDDRTLDTRLLLSHFNFERNNIVAVYYDAGNERLFLGSLSNGLFVFTKKRFRVLAAGKAGPDAVLYSQAPYDNGQVLTGNGSVLGLDAASKTLFRIKNRSDKFSLLVDRRGNIWTKNRKVLSVLDHKGSVLLHSWHFPDVLSRLYEGIDGTIWAGTSKGDLYRIRQVTEEISLKPFFHCEGGITYMQQASDNILWVSAEGGLYRLQVAERKADAIPGLRNIHVQSLYVPGKDEVWITTREDGFFFYHQDTLTKFPLDKKGYLSNAHCMLEDDDGYFWISTNKGLLEAKKTDLLSYRRRGGGEVYYFYYDKNFGFSTNEFNGGCQPCGLKLDNGFLSFPSMSGMVWFDPLAIRKEFPDKGLFIDQVELDGDPVTNTHTLLLPYQFKTLRLFVSTPYFGNEYNIHMEYLLLHNTDTLTTWKTVKVDRPVICSSLPPGGYEILVRMRSGFGAGNYVYKSVRLKVSGVFYTTWWFRIVVALSLLTVVWFYVRFRMKYVEHKNKMLQARIDSDTKELQETLGQLRLSEIDLRRQNRIQELLITAITHDIKSPLKYMVWMTRHLRQHSLKDLEEENTFQKATEVLYDASYRMYHLTDNLLQYIKFHSRFHNAQDAAEEFLLYDLVEERIRIFSDIAISQSTQIMNRVSPELKIRENYLLLGVIIHNLLDNAIKFTTDGKIVISGSAGRGHLHILIADTGVGMDPALVAWYNDFYNSGDKTDADQAMPVQAGMGLLIVKELIKLIGGKVLIENASDSGTIVRLTLKR